MIPLCAAPGCTSPRTKDSDLCLTHEQAGYMNIAIALEATMDRPAPVMPAARIWDAIAKRINEGEKAK